MRTEARRTGKSFKDVVNDYLRMGLQSRRKPRNAKPYDIEPKPMGLRPGLNYDSISELIEQVEGPFHR